jgi:hypothetical protein
MQYQLWAIADGKPVSAGMYTEDKDSRLLWPTFQMLRLLPLHWKKRRKSGSYYGKYVCNGRSLIVISIKFRQNFNIK